ncbi:MAG: lycopene cyclase [Winogradskyella sp.]|uniref:lycopene cyclase family protein n=1 Tax=Winogradskyella sp. TaxID=1883156 RepID=UPI001827F2A3|nr:lycopene cyclase family protein [Winogradskyella sp.]MBT8243929.1 lycopene cyclase [Winogradskyella sp.]NNK23212.1 lycopene cyclase [Winogradskyella sp.]
MKIYDYIILGAGASGLMLAYRMASDAFFDDKSILIIDKEKDKGNDRTWCYWEKKKDEWETILHKTWNTIFFGGETFQDTIDISPYTYKMIRSEAFYKSLWETINTNPNIEFVQAEVEDFKDANKVKVVTSKGVFQSKKLFNSIPNSSFLDQEKYPVLQQHFVGWFVKIKTDAFDASVATFMDFTIPQKGNTRFMYVLPTDKQTALFEYTLFSKDLLEFSEYENAIKSYLEEKNIKDYEIVETEKGSIPMTSYKFSKLNTKNVLNIGTAGGWTKASTGYTFKNTTKKTKVLVSFLKSQNDLSKFSRHTKFWFYDLLFLDVLANENEKGAALFTSLFKKAKTETILKFLDEETSLLEDLKIITSVPSMQFIKALTKRMF